MSGIGDCYSHEKNKVTILIVNWNAGDYLLRCINSIPLAFPIIIVDNASSDDSIPQVLKVRPDIRLIQLPQNLGFSAANNIGLKEIHTQYVLFLNPDTEIINDAIEQLIIFLENHPAYDAVGPQLIDKSGLINPISGRRHFTLWAGICESFFLEKMFPKSSIFNWYNHPEWDRLVPRNVECLAGCAMLMRTEKVKEIGGLDEQVPLYLDDIDLCYRLRSNGGEIYCLPSAKIKHIQNVCGSQAPLGFITSMECEARYIYLKKHCSQGQASIYRLATGLSALMRMIISGPLSLIKHQYYKKFIKSNHRLLWSLFYKIEGVI